MEKVYLQTNLEEISSNPPPNKSPRGKLEEILVLQVFCIPLPPPTKINCTLGFEHLKEIFFFVVIFKLEFFHCQTS